MTGSGPAGDAVAMRPWLRILLIASLALNLVFVGLAAAAIWRHHEGGGWRVPKHIAFVRAIEEIAPQLAPAKRQTARSVVERMRRDVLPFAERRKDARKKAIAAMLAESYKEAELAAALAALRESRNESDRVMHALALELFRGFTNEERHRFFEIYRKQRYRHHGWRRSRWHEREGR
ncbi:MAG: hypothetical protein Kow0032_00620 [Methyloligellaceae bacterium]